MTLVADQAELTARTSVCWEITYVLFHFRASYAAEQLECDFHFVEAVEARLDRKGQLPSYSCQELGDRVGMNRSNVILRQAYLCRGD